MKTKDARSLTSEAQEAIRFKSVQAVIEKRKQVDVAQIFGVTRQAVGKWVKSYEKDGFKGLRSRERGRPQGGSLKAWQAAQIVKTIVGRTPDQLKLPFYLWTREAVSQLIEKRFQIQLSVWTVGRYLAKWGFTPQKPVRRAFEQNPKEVQNWLEQEYPTIKAKSKLEKAIIYWCDEMGLRSDHSVGRSYGRRGETPVIPGTGQRFGCNMISAITNQGHLNFMVFRHKFQSSVFMNFLKRMLKQHSRKLFLIVDKHSVHRSSNVKMWLDKNHHRISLFFLPAYSPELNPDELLNQDTKSNTTGRQRSHNQKELISTVRRHLRKRQRQPKTVKKYFNGKHVEYASV